MIKIIIKNTAVMEVFTYTYHRFIHNFDFHNDHHKNPKINKLFYGDCISGITYSTFGYMTNTMKPAILYWSLATVTHPIIHTYEIKLWPFSYIQKRHEQHHLNPKTKFGPVTPICEIIFGTEYDLP